MSFYLETALKQKNQQKTQTEYFKLFKGKPFWIPDKLLHESEYDKTKKKCCFWHIIGLPEKEGRGRLPCFDYELDLYQAIEQDRYIWLKKSAGLGISTFMLYYLAYKSITSPTWKGKQVVIITGPNIDIAISLVERLKRLFPPNILPSSKETVCNIDGVHIQAFPSWNLDAARGVEKPICIWIDEADFFPIGQAQDARGIAERYIGKSPGLSIVMTSTPNAPEGLFQTIERLPDDQCLYHRLIYTYEVGLNKIYLPSEIAKARESPSFPREYEGRYIGLQGNYFSERSIQACIKLGQVLESKRKGLIPLGTIKSMGVDSAFGDTSKFGIVVSQLTSDGVVEVIYSNEFDKPNFPDIISEIINIRENYNVQKLYCDDSNPEVLRALKLHYKEPLNWKKEIELVKTRRGGASQIRNWMDIIPVNFRTEHRDMLSHVKVFLDNEALAISPKQHNKLVIALRSAYATDGNLNKDLTVHDDCFDALRLSLKDYSLQSSV